MAYIQCMFRNILGYDPLLVYIYIFISIMCYVNSVCVMIFVVSIQTDRSNNG